MVNGRAAEMLPGGPPGHRTRASRGVMISSAPKLRTDLPVGEKKPPGGGFFVEKDPLSGIFSRLGEANPCVAQQLGGEPPMGVVGQGRERQSPPPPPAGTLNAF